MDAIGSEQKSELIRAARAAAARAYCPFSKFRVGAAALTAEGAVFTGCNIENESFSLTICAERVAIWNAISSGAKRLVALAITFPDAPAGSPAGMKMPCGACRQVMAQFAAPEMILIVDQVGESSLREILPSPFRMLTTAKEPAAAP